MKRAPNLGKLVDQFRFEHPDLDQQTNSMLDRLISDDWAAGGKQLEYLND